MVLRIVSVVVAVGVIAVVGSVLVGARRWKAGTEELRSRLEASPPLVADGYDPGDVDHLPEPVQRYFAAVLTPGQRRVVTARVTHTGRFNMSETGEQWRPFVSDQLVVTSRPGFDWDARIRMMPGVTAFVHDAYVAGEGVLHASALGLVSVVDMRGTPEIARGELMRFLAESAWYPTVLLPGGGVEWEAIDERSAAATLTDGNTTVTMVFHFGEDHLIQRVTAASRDRVVGGTTEPVPWEGRFSGYERRDGMLVPLDGDVAWLLPEGRKSYWRGHIERVEYEFS
jgi:hypothetical protein